MKCNTILSALLCGTILLTGCEQHMEKAEAFAYRIEGDTVRLSGEGWTDNLRITEVEPVAYSREIVTAGTVRPIPTQYANIAPPFAGRVVKSCVRMGQQVKKGEPLFEIICPDFTAAQKDFFQAKSACDLARKDLRRKEDLIRNGVSSQKELEEAQNALLTAEKDFENAQAALHVYQVEDLVSMSLGQPLVVRAPLSGTLIENNIVNGQYLKDDSDPIAVVADLSNVWVSAQVKEKDIRFIREGDSLDIEVAALPDELIKGVVYHVEEAVDESTRSIRVISECRNGKERLKLGMYATVHFKGIPQRMLQVPETSLLQGIDGSFVYVQIAPEAFVRRMVEVETTSGGKAIIGKGLQAGEKIISEGGYYLK